MTRFPWLIIVGLIGFFIAFVVQFRLKHYVDRNKVLALDDLADLYPSGLPPRRILTQRGQELYRWFYIGVALFIAGIVITIIFEGLHAR